MCPSLLLHNHLLSSSHLVVKGSIRNVSHDSENHMSQVDVSVQKVYRQKNRIFQQDEASGEWQGPVRTLLQCKVKKGGGVFLFTGNEHFGEAWLGCAPRFKDFLFVYRAARERAANPCEFQLD
ncbi:meteorin-like protein [Limosa lapponica baueri]|uniref:Meteorin-like protein n=1 Tax=Limosa lapponica baueri TaxID=1758121 RepID=A0A2I0TGR8_LIMLA|nr:meteorin-like protein [Limosa lapponica baueri]